MKAMPSSGRTVGATEPQVRQKGRSPFSDERYTATASSPASQRKLPVPPIRKVANIAPWCLRHMEQWQCTMES